MVVKLVAIILGAASTNIFRFNCMQINGTAGVAHLYRKKSSDGITFY